MNQSDSDLLRRAAATMRAERTGHNPGSGFTRARILNDLRVERRKRNRWWRIGFPLGMVLVGTTAWASANGTLPAVWSTVSSFLNLPVTDNGVSERVVGSPQPRGTALGTNSPDLAATSSLDTNELEPETSGVEPATPDEVSDPNEALQPATPVQQDSAQASSVAPPTAALKTPAPNTTVARERDDAPLRSSGSPMGDQVVAPGQLPSSTSLYPDVAAPAMEAEIRAFRVADDLYRRHGQLDAAVDAYRRYVRDYPAGRFVPEAKYNTALALMKLGRTAEARPLLQPFADGLYGTYRRDAARKLLDALE
jgi:TolA-binding protein